MSREKAFSSPAQRFRQHGKGFARCPSFSLAHQRTQDIYKPVERTENHPGANAEVLEHGVDATLVDMLPLQVRVAGGDAALVKDLRFRDCDRDPLMTRTNTVLDFLKIHKDRWIEAAQPFIGRLADEEAGAKDEIHPPPAGATG